MSEKNTENRCRRGASWRPPTGFWPLLAAWLIFSTVGLAAESWRPFLEGLRQRDMHDMALLYLERMSLDPRCPAELRESLDYEAGLTLMTGSRAERLASARLRMLDDARGRFEKFLAARPDHPLASMASSQLANILVERGRMQAWLASQGGGLSADQKEKLLAESRQYFSEADKVFQKAKQRFMAAIERLGTTENESDDSPKKKEEMRLRGDLLQTQIFQATVTYEIALTYPPDSRPRKAKLAESARQYNDVFAENSDRLAGLYARLWEGRCYREMGQPDKAIVIFNELLDRSDDTPPGRELTNKTLVVLLETLIQPEVMQYAAAVEKYDAWLKKAVPAEQSSADGLALEYLVAAARLEQARVLGKNAPARTKLLAEARRCLESVARVPGGYQAQAAAKLMDPLLAGSAGQTKTTEPTTFAEAIALAGAAKGRMRAAEAQGPSQIKNADQNSAIAQAASEAIANYRAALALAGSGVPAEDVNLARYDLAWLYWKQGSPYDAAALSEFLARRCPRSPIACQAAQIALVAYDDLSNRASSESAKQFARRRMAGVALLLTERWPTSPEAADAWLMLVHAACRDDDLEKAQAELDRFPAGLARRGEAEFMLGRAYWNRWARASRLPEGERPDAPTLAAMLAHAQDLLSAGVEKAAATGQIDAPLVAASLALVQLYLDQNNPAKAVHLLELPNTGVLALAATGHPATRRPGMTVEIYKTALRAYVAARQFDKAEAVMDALEKSAGGEADADSAARLTEIYVGLGRDLKDQLRSLQEQGLADELREASRGFELFLKRVASRKQGNSFGSMAWVAGSLAEMAERFDSDADEPPPEAEKFYAQAAAVYEELLKRVGNNASFAPDAGAVDAVKIRLAGCLRRLGRYDQALDLLVDVLKRRNRMVDAQIEAAKTYQDWAKTSGDALHYLEAIQGARLARRKDGSTINIVWGWAKLASMLLRGEERLDSFYEARYRLALCRLEWARSLSGKEKAAALAQAERDIVVTQLLGPTLGGPARWAQFDALLKTIQTARGQTPTGLKKPPAKPAS